MAIGSGTIGSNKFTGISMTFTGNADSTAVSEVSPGVLMVPLQTGSVSLQGIGTAGFVDPFDFYVNQNIPGVGFIDILSGDVLDIGAPEFASYDAVSQLGPIPVDVLSFAPFETTDGLLTLTSANGAGFVAVESAAGVPITVYSFTGSPDGGGPYAGLVMDAAGNLYGTTYQGGSAGDGTVFELTAASAYSTEIVLYSFTGSPDGALPYAGLVMDAAGNLYGTTYEGGSSGYGTVFELTAASAYSTEIVLYSFTGFPDGAFPYAGLVMDAAGNLYGTTYQGGSAGDGSVFELTAASAYSTEIVLYSFTGSPDGTSPYAGLVMDAASNLYGTTYQGGSAGDGTVFELTAASAYSTEIVLHSFTGSPDGALPYAGLVMDAASNLYGTTYQGGSTGNGTVFELTAASAYSTESVLHSFAGSSDGALPYAGLVLDAARNLYGTTYQGGSAGYGTVFELTSASAYSTESVLHSFTGSPDGALPYAGLVMDAAGNLYGTTHIGGSNGDGTAFEVTVTTATATPTVTATATATPTVTATATPTATATTTPTATATASATATPTTTPTPVAVKLTIKPTTLRFDTVEIGSHKGPKKITVSNPKSSKRKPGITVLMEGLSGGASQYRVTNSCGDAPLAPGG